MATTEDYQVHKESLDEFKSMGHIEHYEDVMNKIQPILKDSFDFSDNDSIGYILDGLKEMIELEMGGETFDITPKAIGK